MEKKQAPGSDEPEVAPTEAKPKKPMMKYIIIGATVLIQITAAYYLQKTFLFAGPAVEVTAEDEHAEEEEEVEGAHGEGGPSIVTLEEIVVNPAGTGGRRYLAVTIALKSGATEVEKKIEESKPLIRDALITLLSSKALDQLADISYRDSLKSEVKAVLNGVDKKLKIETVVFSGYVLQ